MLTMRCIRVVAVLGAVGLLPAVAFAEQGKDKDKGPKSAAAVASSAAPAAGSASAQAQKESPDQRKRRQAYTLGTADKIRSITKLKQKQMTAEMRGLVKQHWRVAMRLLRVQRIAENAGKPAVAKRAIDALAKEDARFFAKLEDLAKTAPAAAASASASAAPGASAAPSAAKPAASGGNK